MPNPRLQDERLAALYEKVPAMLDCKGKCADSCGPIECSTRERQKIERDQGRKLEACPVECSMLTVMGRCSVYADRPMICRLWGTSRAMACEHGCTPERWLTDDEFYDLLVESFVIGGPPPGMKVDVLQRSLQGERMGRQMAVYGRAIQLVRLSRIPLAQAVEIATQRQEGLEAQAEREAGRARRQSGASPQA